MVDAKKDSYWRNITSSTSSLWAGLSLTFRHILKARKNIPLRPITDPAYFQHSDGIATIQFPHEMLPVPDTGRYRLHNEIDDCIVCDKCAKVCPVNCIDIEPIKSPDEIGKTSDGTPKRIYAAKFDIDMGKCCFCGLCTTVCPTECLTMTKVYDFSVFDIREHNFEFGEMSVTEIDVKKKVWDDHQKNKIAQQVAPTVTPVIQSQPEKTDDAGAVKPSVPKPVFRPKIKPPGPPPATT